ncbi:hypothetical protein SAMN04487905_103394 [Actinopolyspora xinjiangensis]|uniref:Uncharacterized protein n=1 Tax=Actinopolyspora xinjiangensis TaxID=405564 RepID=A0A1H0S5T3_9ACTN|nr:hypothetical protein [Actinopolyspora xinjiangensis]SDP37090.1 hypothetical protein SAMN04487905_103394 [Actinopolyspora xinjiangensis]
MRNQLSFHRNHRFGRVLTTAEVLVRLCCRTVVASGSLEARGNGGLGEWIIRAGASSKAPCSSRRHG